MLNNEELYSGFWWLLDTDTRLVWSPQSLLFCLHVLPVLICSFHPSSRVWFESIASIFDSLASRGVSRLIPPQGVTSPYLLCLKLFTLFFFLNLCIFFHIKFGSNMELMDEKALKPVFDNCKHKRVRMSVCLCFDSTVGGPLGHQPSYN